MKLAIEHPFSLSPKEAADLQKKLSPKVKIAKLPLKKIRLIAGVDVSYSKKSQKLFAAVVVVSFPELKVIERSGVVDKATFPYIPGLLFFREGKAAVKALQSLEAEPDLLMVDGHGLAHPRNFGVASHLGVIFNKPSLGIAKKPLSGEFSSPEEKPWSKSPIFKEGKEVGFALRTKPNCRPVYVSLGHLIDLETALKLVLKTTTKYRQPEPVRLAHIFSNELRSKAGD